VFFLVSFKFIDICILMLHENSFSIHSKPKLNGAYEGFRFASLRSYANLKKKRKKEKSTQKVFEYYFIIPL